MARLRQLQCFVTAAEEGHVTRAARVLNTSQTALSQAIAQLESQIGVELLVRHPRGVSLTPAGATLFVKARAALAAAEEAELTAQSLARAAGCALRWGFTSTPPALATPELCEAFASAHPEVEISFHALPWPRESTAAWLQEVDVALCYNPTPHPEVSVLALREEPRVVVAAAGHPLAGRSELAVGEVLDETFCGMHPALEPVRAGFWRLDDHRGGPARVTADHAQNAQESLAVVASGRAIITAPRSIASRHLGATPGITLIPLRDAYPSTLALAWQKLAHQAHVDELAAIARRMRDPASAPIARGARTARETVG